MKPPSAASLRLTAALLVGVLVGMGVWLVLMVEHAEDDARALADSYGRGYSGGVIAGATTKDVQLSAKSGYMPLYMQKDPQWAGMAYSDETIGTYGCGLTCAAMAVSYLDSTTVTPDLLAAFVGESCLTDRVNDMAKFSAYLAKSYHLQQRETFWGTDDALKAVDDGWVVFAGVSGELGERSYGSHVVMIWRSNGDGTYLLRDPDDGANSIKTWTKDELLSVGFMQFDAVKG